MLIYGLLTSASAQRETDLKEVLRVSKSAETTFLEVVRKDYYDLRSQLDLLKDVVHGESSATQQAINEWQSTYETMLATTSAKIADDTRQSLTSYAVRKMLASLYFVQSKDRQTMILDAHRTTFDWIFDDDFSCDSSGLTFTEWLKEKQSQKGLFYIRGKPGSGKSCFMRYLAEHPKMPAHLQEWAREKPLLMASSFFWRAGTKLQKSLIGMLRTILYQLLEQQPSLMQIAHPERWRAYYLGQTNLTDWSEQELTSSFARLFTEASDSVRFMILVDGLDEYEGSDAQRQNLVDLLVRIAQYENVKICVSSRPWPIFQGAFEKYPSLSLEALTRGDVATYVRDHFNENPNFVALSKIKPTQCSNLELQIVEKASGVFLWVYLVVRDMLQRLQAGASIGTLFKRLDLLPRELDDFFMQIIESIDLSEREDAAKIFQLVMELPKWQTTLFTLSFTEEVNVDFALHLEHDDLSQVAIDHRLLTMRRRLASRCKGLLEVGAEIKRSRWSDWSIEFLHRHVSPLFFQTVLFWVLTDPIYRTVYDFFCQNRDLRDRLSQFINGPFDVPRYMCNASLMEFLVLTDTNQTSGPFMEAGQDAVAIVVTLLQYAARNDQETQSVPLNLLSVLEQRLKENWPVSIIRQSTAGMLALPGFGHSQAVRLFAQWQHDAESFLAIAVQYSLTRYAVLQLEEARQVLRNHRTLGRLLDLALNPLPTTQQNIKPIPSPKIVAKLLDLTKPRIQPPETPDHLREYPITLGDKSTKVIMALDRDEHWSRRVLDAWAEIIALLIDHGLFPLEARTRVLLKKKFRAEQAEKLEDLMMRREYVFVES